MRLGEIGRGPLFPAPGPRGKRVLRRVRGIVLSVLGFVVVTALLPLLLVGALVVDLYLKLTSGKPMVGVRLVLFLWWFLFNEIWTLIALTGIYLLTGGPFGKGSMRRRRGIYRLRPAWIGAVLAGLRVLFGIRFEIEGGEAAAQGRALIMMRHASIIDNVLGDTQIAGPHGLGIRYVVKLLDFHHHGPTNAYQMREDVVQLIRMFADTIGGRARYASQPPVIKSICCGLRGDLIGRKFPTAEKLVKHLKTYEWEP